MAKNLDITDPKIVRAHVAAMCQSTGYQIVLQYWNLQREKIIEEGKASRSEERMVRNWARLLAFDEAVSTITKLANLEVEDDSESPVEE